MFQTAVLEWMKIENSPSGGPDRPPSSRAQKFLQEYGND